MRALLVVFCAAAIVTQVFGDLDCPDPNSELVINPNPCPRTCDQMTPPWGGCNRTSSPEGCVCIFGYVLDAEGICIESTQCPPKPCPKNEYWNTCPDWCMADDYCARYVDGLEVMCTMPLPEELFCKPACTCKNGFVRAWNGCISAKKCCPQPSTRLVDCPAPCDRTCEGPPPKDCLDYCPMRKCVCAKGYVRSGEVCIPECECPKPKA